jgi:AbrB family looped-hinge helix DNA binding protein
LLNITYYDIVPDMNKLSQKKFLGITTLGEKGQMVIPAEARAALKLAKGEKLIVMSAHEDSFIIMKASRFEAMASHFTKHLASMRKLIKKGPKQ